ncbi:MAG: hypothetical protein U0176_03285 [Bacteroidia bacterium]
MSYRFLLAFVLGLPVLGLAQGGINGGFEDLHPNGTPIGWNPADGGGASTSKDAHLGKVAAKTWIQRYYDAGVWKGNLSVDQGNANQVSGYYKYLGDKTECDKGVVTYLMGARSEAGMIDTIAYGMTELKLSKEYKLFNLSVSAVGSGTPDFVNIQFMPAGRCNEHGESNCCFLFVDDVVLSGTAGIKQPAPEEPIKASEEILEEEEAAPVTPIGENKGIAPVEETPEEEAQPEEAPVEEAVPAEETQPEENGSNVKEEPAEEQPVEEVVPAEEESTVPVDEEWDSEEESSDGGR